MITKIYSIISLNILILICVAVRAHNESHVNEGANSLDTKINNQSQPHFSMIPQSRGERGVYYSEPFIGHEYHESIEEPQYIFKLMAPPKQSRDPGIAELLLVLAPLAVIPLIGSAALTTFTALFATGNYGRRRKRDLLTRQLLSQSFTEVQPTDDYVSQKVIGSQHNVGVESLWATTGTNINSDEKRHRFDVNDLVRTKSLTFGRLTTPESKSQLIAVKAEDVEQNNWKPIDWSHGNGRTGGHKSSPIMTNTSRESLESKDELKSIVSLVKGFGKRFSQTISSDETYRQKEKYISKREPELTAQLEPMQPIHRQQYMSSSEKSAYRSSTDFRPDIIVKNNNTNDESISKRETQKSREKKIFDNNGAKRYRNFKDMSDPVLPFGKDLSAMESETIAKRTDGTNADDNNKSDNKAKSDTKFEFNTWIPFLSNPYLADIARGEGKREIQELDVIQKYLNAMGRPDYNDEIIASYLSCNGMVSPDNQCLERLTCQFSDATSGMKQLEKDVSALVIYSLLKNQHIDNGFKSRLQRAAFHGKDNPGQCNFYNCPKNNINKNNKKRR